MFILVEVPIMSLTLPGSNVADVFLNNKFQKFCLYADAEEGYVERAVLNKNNEPKLSDSSFAVETERVCGDVKIRIPCKSISDFELFAEAYLKSLI